MKTMKKILALVLAVVMLLGVAPSALADRGTPVALWLRGLLSPQAASYSGDVSFSNTGVPLLNLRTYQSSSVLSKYVYANGGKLNGGEGFTRTDYNAVNMAEPPYYFSDAYTHYFQRVNSDSTWRARYSMYTSYSEYNEFNNLISAGEISFSLRAEVEHEFHAKAFKHAHWFLDDMGLIRFYAGSDSYQIKELINSESDKDETYTMKGGDWNRMPTDTAGRSLGLYLWHNQGDTCWDGDSGVHYTTIAFADLTAPRVTGLTLLDDASYANNSGTIKFRVTFNEKIRFADTSKTSWTSGDGNRIRLDAYQRSNNQTVQDCYATLTAIGDNYLEYEYTVPEEATDIIIRGISADQTGGLIHNDEPLYMYTIDGKYERLEGADGKPMTTNALFTDLAGNSINQDNAWTAVAFPQAVHVDNIAPEYGSSSIVGSMMMGGKTEDLGDEWNKVEDSEDWPEDIDRSQVFAGVGDTLTFSIDFNEELKSFSAPETDVTPMSEAADAQKFTATLNIKEGGEAVTLTGASVSSVSLGVDTPTPVTRVTFAPLEITAEMVPEDDSEPIHIVSVAVEGDVKVKDLCNNALSMELTNLAAAKQQEWLDTVAPSVQFEAAEEENTTRGDGESVTGFVVPFQVLEKSYGTDVVSNPTLYRSGTVGVGDGELAQESGVFTVGDTDSEGAIFEYIVNTSPDTPGEGEEWSRSVIGAGAFPQIDGKQYLHVRLAEDSPAAVMKPTVTVRGYDYAGNSAAKEEAVEGVQMPEHVAPSSTATLQQRLLFNEATAVGSFTAHVRGVPRTERTEMTDEKERIKR